MALMTLRRPLGHADCASNPAPPARALGFEGIVMGDVAKAQKASEVEPAIDIPAKAA
jgi:hypothetical protein